MHRSEAAARSLFAGVSVFALMISCSESAQADATTYPASANGAAANSAENTDPGNGIAEGSAIVVTATRINEIAPTTASLEARQPQSIVSRSLIEDSLPATADFNQIALITPSVSNFNGNNGVGLSESKAQRRQRPDCVNARTVAPPRRITTMFTRSLPERDADCLTSCCSAVVGAHMMHLI